LIGHINADELASYRAGATSASRASKIATHLAGCVRCAGVDASLANVSALLAGVPALPMPDNLSGRVVAALATESAQRATAMTAAAAAGTAPAAPTALADGSASSRTAGATGADAPRAADASPPGYRRWRLRMPDWSSPLVLRSLAATGVLVLLAGGGFLLASAHHGSGTPTSGPIAAPGPRKGAVSHGYHGANVSATDEVRYKYKGTYLDANAIQSRADFTASDLVSGVRAVVASTPAISPEMPVPQATGGTNGSSTSSPLVRIGGVSANQLTGCLSNVASGRKVLLADVAHYLGKPAVIIVLKPVTGAFGVIVVGLACTATDADAITRLSVPKS
jgi:hypothetical protein